MVASKGVRIIALPRDRLSLPVQTGLEWQAIESTEPPGNLQAGGALANPHHDFAQKTGAVLEATAVTTGTIHRRQEFMPQIAVAVLDIDKIEACFLSQHRRIDKILDQLCDLVIAHQRIIVGQLKFSVEQ